MGIASALKSLPAMLRAKQEEYGCSHSLRVSCLPLLEFKRALFLGNAKGILYLFLGDVGISIGATLIGLKK